MLSFASTIAPLSRKRSEAGDEIRVLEKRPLRAFLVGYRRAPEAWEQSDALALGGGMTTTFRRLYPICFWGFYLIDEDAR